MRVHDLEPLLPQALTQAVGGFEASGVRADTVDRETFGQAAAGQRRIVRGYEFGVMSSSAQSAQKQKRLALPAAPGAAEVDVQGVQERPLPGMDSREPPPARTPSLRYLRKT